MILRRIVMVRLRYKINFCRCTVHLDTIKVSLCTTHRAHTPPWTWYNMLPHHRVVHNDVLLPTVFINVTLATLKCKLWWRSWTETCRSNFNLRFNVNFNVNFSGLWDWYRVHLLVNEGLWWYKIKLDTTHYLFCCDWSVYVTSLWRRGLTFPTHMTRTVLSDRASWYCTVQCCTFIPTTFVPLHKQIFVMCPWI